MDEQCLVDLGKTSEDRRVRRERFADPDDVRMTKTDISAARWLRRILAAINAPCSVKAQGRCLIFRRDAVTICDRIAGEASVDAVTICDQFGLLD